MDIPLEKITKMVAIIVYYPSSPVSTFTYAYLWPISSTGYVALYRGSSGGWHTNSAVTGYTDTIINDDGITVKYVEIENGVYSITLPSSSYPWRTGEYVYYIIGK